MAISTCAFPSFYMFCSYSRNIRRIFSNQLLHRFHCNTPKHELTGGSKSRKQVERSKACHINSYDLHGHVPHLLRLPNSKKNLTRPKCPETLSQIMRSRIQVRVFGFSTVFISSYRSVECPPRPSKCTGRLRVQMFPQPPAHVMITWPSSLEKYANFEAGADANPEMPQTYGFAAALYDVFQKSDPVQIFKFTYNYLCSTAYVFYI